LISSDRPVRSTVSGTENGVSGIGDSVWRPRVENRNRMAASVLASSEEEEDMLMMIQLGR
jgi:hypothetical protein